jgi:phosphatidate cytidylyltransferase
MLIFGMPRGELASSLPSASFSILAIPYVVLSLGSLVLVRQWPRGAYLLLYLFLVVWAGDTFAYYTGRAIGRHYMAPRISPKKTWEGAAASLAGSIVVGVLVLEYAPQVWNFLLKIRLAPAWAAAPAPAPLWSALLLSVLLNLAAQLGDLVESMMKRGAGLKDSGSILPGHGGMLDRIDALLLAAPVLWYYAHFRGIQL